MYKALAQNDSENVHFEHLFNQNISVADCVHDFAKMAGRCISSNEYI